jgi:hypothetical protein
MISTKETDIRSTSGPQLKTWTVLSECHFNALSTFIEYKKQVLGATEWAPKRTAETRSEHRSVIQQGHWCRHKGFYKPVVHLIELLSTSDISKLTHHLLVVSCVLCAVNNKGVNTYSLIEYPFQILKQLVKVPWSDMSCRDNNTTPHYGQVPTVIAVPLRLWDNHRYRLHTTARCWGSCTRSCLDLFWKTPCLQSSGHSGWFFYCFICGPTTLWVSHTTKVQVPVHAMMAYGEGERGSTHC